MMQAFPYCFIFDLLRKEKKERMPRKVMLTTLSPFSLPESSFLWLRETETHSD